MLLFAPSFGRILLTPHLFITAPSSSTGVAAASVRSLRIPLLFSLPLAPVSHPRIRAILRNASQLASVPSGSRHANPSRPPSLAAVLSRHPATLFSRIHPPVLHPGRSLSLSSPPPPPLLVDELRGNEREQGRSNRSSTEIAFLSRYVPPFVFRRAFILFSLSFFLSSFIFLPLFCLLPLSLIRAFWKLYKMLSHFSAHSPLSLSLFLSFYHCFSLYPSYGCTRALFFLFILTRSFPYCSPPVRTFRARFIPTHPCGNVSSTETAIVGFFSFGLFFASPRTFLASNIEVIF